MIVVDASVVVTAISVAGADGERSRDRLIQGVDLHAPDLLDLEVLAVLRRRANFGDIDEAEAGVALEALGELRLTRYPHLPLLPRVWTLRTNLSPYDAAYVALAEELGCPLVTGDRRIARAPGVGCAVEVL
ncbi:MAG: type II toxin-antitoxin system VapC family toxin [Actinobacteria bacterium]|nr:type II toxin-antitoxin system VapC family toxin [Actinomycetota bacterium]